MANKKMDFDNWPVSHHVDGNNVSKVFENPRLLEVERGHTFFTDEKTGKRTERPDWASDRD